MAIDELKIFQSNQFHASNTQTNSKQYPISRSDSKANPTQV